MSPEKTNPGKFEEAQQETQNGETPMTMLITTTGRAELLGRGVVIADLDKLEAVQRAAVAELRHLREWVQEHSCEDTADGALDAQADAEERLYETQHKLELAEAQIRELKGVRPCHCAACDNERDKPLRKAEAELEAQRVELNTAKFQISELEEEIRVLHERLDMPVNEVEEVAYSRIEALEKELARVRALAADHIGQEVNEAHRAYEATLQVAKEQNQHTLALAHVLDEINKRGA